MKKALYIAVLVVYFLLNHPTTHAFTYNRDPFTNEVNNPIRFTATWNENEMDQPFDPLDSTICLYFASNEYEYVAETGSNISGSNYSFDVYITIPQDSETNNPSEMIPFNTPINDVIAIGCETFSGVMYFEQNSNTSFMIVPAISNNTMWGSNNGFWGSTTPIDIMGTMAASVQETGENIWPLFKILGVLVGFMIAYYLVYFIKLELEPRKVAAAPGKTDEFIEHNPPDLEFKREYGAEPIKRKRGRPRKDV